MLLNLSKAIMSCWYQSMPHQIFGTWIHIYALSLVMSRWKYCVELGVVCAWTCLSAYVPNQGLPCREFPYIYWYEIESYESTLGALCSVSSRHILPMRVKNATLPFVGCHGCSERELAMRTGWNIAWTLQRTPCKHKTTQGLNSHDQPPESLTELIW